jgi:ABC-type transport system involved in multi-copper enzyme maturation permease subunit
MVAALRRLSPLGPIFVKELRALSRRRRSYLLRFAYLGLLLLFLLVGYSASSVSHSPGGVATQIAQQNRLASAFFITFTLYSIVAMALIGPVLTCTAINAEKLARTLDVLLMTPLNAWQIVAGKLASRLLAAFTLLGLSLPVLAVVRLLGGVELEQLFAVVSLAAAAVTSGAALGLLLSALIRRAYSVLLLSYATFAFVYVILPLLLAVSSTGMPTRGFGLALSLNPAAQGVTMVERVPFSMLHWTTTVAIHFAFAFVATVLAALLVRRAGRASVAEAVQAGVATELLGRPQRSVGDNPVSWRESRRPMFPRRWQRVVAAFAVLGILLWSYWAIVNDNSTRNALIADAETHLGYAFIFHTLLWVLAIVLGATAIAHEKETDTWTLLIATPLSGSQIVRGKLVGTLRKLVWPLVVPAAHFALFAAAGTISWVAAGLTLAVMVCFIAPWLAIGLWLSLAVKKVTTAVVVGLLIPVAMFAIVPILLAMFDDDYAEAILPILPYYYEAYAIDALSPFDPSSRSNYTFQPMGWSLSDTQFATLTLVVCGAHLALAMVLLGLLAWRFDALVGRAEAGETNVLAPA